MGLIVDISDRVSVELRRESFILYVVHDGDTENVEFSYQRVPDIIKALAEVTGSERFIKHMDLTKK